jgi:hypothetical protein
VPYLRISSLASASSANCRRAGGGFLVKLFSRDATCTRKGATVALPPENVRVPKRGTRLSRSSIDATCEDCFTCRRVQSQSPVGDNKVYRRLNAINYGAGLRACRPIVVAGLSRFFRRQIDRMLLLINVPALLYTFVITSAAI